MKAGTGTSDDQRATAQQHDPSDAIGMVLGQAERPDIADRSADHVDAVDAESVEDPAQQVGDERPILVPREVDRTAETPAGPIEDETPEPGMPAMSDGHAPGPTVPWMNSTGGPDPTSCTRSLARGRRISTNRVRGANP